jgi:hypothetical protein
MNEFESRLRAAMQAVAEVPPPGLIDQVHRRHRRHVRRVAAGWTACVAAVAIASPVVAHALSADTGPGHRPGTGPAVTGSPVPSVSGTTSPAGTPSPSAARGTVLSGCATANPGAVGNTWRSGLKVGPLYFLPGNAAVSPRAGGSVGSKPHLYVVVLVIAGLKPGSTVVVRAAPAGRGDIRFLFGPADSMNAGTAYTMSSGETGVTFVACPAGTGFAASQTVTDYYGGFLVRGYRCVPVEVWADGRGQPFRVGLGACR